MKHCNLCQTPIKEYQLQKRISHNQNANVVGGRSMTGMFMGMAFGLGRNSIKDSHLGCYKWFWKFQVWFVISSSLIGAIGFILFAFGPLIVMYSSRDINNFGPYSIITYLVSGLALMVFAWILLFAGSLFSKSKTKDGKHMDDFIDEEMFRIYKSRVKQADENLANGSPIADISKSVYLQELKFDDEKKSYTVSKMDESNMMSGTQKVQSELEVAQAKIKEQEELLKKLQNENK
ncbi:hypothetical protein STIUS_v1c05310 [Spiroplasma sp. TIUS-1]|uniref:hypothetical protein n=1 Tax=Spiroplasma sp. TIUS-1 TaxID=216963 RepID=UPI0013985034|nr:hypothetical protein [Spiroplasma sp. TIUS-1]QHX36085.1 hypothetical protein STIUS_v1c05310 [Spiroplasma sp. TIUS-1]